MQRDASTNHRWLLWALATSTLALQNLEVLTVGALANDVGNALAVDASQRGLGACLYQELPPRRPGQLPRRRCVSFASKALNAAQQNYDAHKRELLALVWAMRKYCHDPRRSRVGSECVPARVCLTRVRVCEAAVRPGTNEGVGGKR